MKGGSKYQPLLEYLRRSNQPEVMLSFAEVEVLLGDRLPDSARSQRGWWSNRSQGALQATAWMDAGYLVSAVDLTRQQVTFRKPLVEYKVRPVGEPVLWNHDLVRALRLHLNFTQAQLATELGVRQQTISEWEQGVYAPSRAMSKYLSLVAERASFRYRTEG